MRKLIKPKSAYHDYKFAKQVRESLQRKIVEIELRLSNKNCFRVKSLVKITSTIIWAMASQTQGIQQLLAAEKRAAEKVSEARKRKFIF